MLKKLISVVIALGMCVGTFGTVGCSSGTKDMSKDTTPPPKEAPASEEMNAEVPPDA